MKGNFQVMSSPFCLLFGIFFWIFGEGDGRRKLQKLNLKELGYFLWQNFIWVRSVNSTCLSWEFAWAVQLCIYSIPNVNTLSQNMPIGRASSHLSSGACLLFWLLLKAIWLLNKTGTSLGSVQWCPHAIQLFHRLFHICPDKHTVCFPENVPCLFSTFFALSLENIYKGFSVCEKNILNA